MESLFYYAGIGIAIGILLIALSRQLDFTEYRSAAKKWVSPALQFAGIGIALLSMAWFAVAWISSSPERTVKKLELTENELERLHKRLGLSNRALSTASPHQLLEALVEIRYPDLPALREQFRFWQERSESGRIPAAVKLSAFEALSRLADRLTKQNKCSLAYLPLNCVSGWTAGLNANHSGWKFLGPSQVGGRTRAIAINPNNRNSIWIGSVAGGVWHSTDGGKKFDPVDDLMPSLVISTLVIDTKIPTTLYAGTGEGFFNLDSLRGAGILRTTDDGVTWESIKSTIPTNDDSPFRFVNRLAMSPDGGILLAATRQGIYRSDDVAHETWTLQLPGNIADVKFHPTDSSKAIAGGMDTGAVYYSQDGGRVWKSAEHQENWTHVWPDRPPSPSRVEVVYADADRDNKKSIVYASVDNNSGEVWRSIDDGKSFTKMESITPDKDLAYYLGDQGWYDNSIWAGDPSDPDFIVVGGVNLWKSNDGGNQLIQISDWQQNGSIHADHHIIVSDPAFDGVNDRIVFFGNDGGLYRTDDITKAGTDTKKVQGWTNLNNNYGVTQFYGIAWNKKSGTLIAGSQDNGTLRLKKDGFPNSWSEEFSGDGGYSAADSVDSQYLFGEYVYLSLHRSSDGGDTARFINGEFVDSRNKMHWKQDSNLVIGDSKNSTANFIAPFVLDTVDAKGNTIIAGGASLWRTTDAKADANNAEDLLTSGPHWTEIKQPVPGWNDASDIPNYISSIAISNSEPNISFVGYNRGDLYMTKNLHQDNPTWSLVLNTSASKRPKRLVSKIVFDPSDGKTIYVAYGGYSENSLRDNVWKTVNGGSTWRNISGALPPAPVYAMTVHPDNNKYIYLGTELGIFASEDGGDHWSLSNEGPINTAVNDFIWIGSELVAATHGRGVWVIDLSIPKARLTALRK